VLFAKCKGRNAYALEKTKLQWFTISLQFGLLVLNDSVTCVNNSTRVTISGDSSHVEKWWWLDLSYVFYWMTRFESQLMIRDSIHSYFYKISNIWLTKTTP